MRILFITHYFAPDSGAAANRLTRLAYALRARGHQVTVLTTIPHYPRGVIPQGYKRRFTVVEDRDGLRVIQVWLWVTRSPKIIWRLLSQISFMLTCILRGLFVQRPDVILIENQPIFTGFAGWVISKIKRRRYVLNVSDHWPEYLVIAGVVKETSIVYRLFKALTNRTQIDATIITAMSKEYLEGIQARLNDKLKDGRIIYNAVDLEKFHPTLNGDDFRMQHQLERRWLITFLGVLGSHIDLDTMLTTAAHFKDQPDIQFLFVGTGAQKNKLTEALRQPDFAHCRHIEWLDADDIPAFWAVSDIHFWALQDNELDKRRFQAKLYEALATGTPTVIATEGIMHDLLHAENMGITVPFGDSNSMIQAIEHLTQDADYFTQIRTNARRYAEAHFALADNINAYERALIDAYEKED
jgi:glycosyltransferase involved in cell wall biosynthesis